MSYSSYSNPFGFRLTPWVKRLIVANLAVFLLTWALPILGSYLAFEPAAVLSRPWTVVTYMFVHGGLMHVLLNMLGLFFFGPILEERWGGKEFLKFYFLAGIAGAALSAFFPHTPIIGASAAIYAVMVAFAVYWPDNAIYIWGIFPIKAKWLVGGLVGLSVFSTLTGGGAGIAHLAHLGGAIFAFAYLKSSFAPPAWGEVHSSPTPARARSLFPWSGQKRPRPVASEPQPAVRRAPRETPRPEYLDEVDRILDKISSAGISSLTVEELQLLDEASRRDRAN